VNYQKILQSFLELHQKYAQNSSNNSLVQKLRQENETLRLHSRKDTLTGLCNRRGIDEYLNNYLALALRHKSELSLALIDIDNFKTINDIHGHLVGDETLKEFAKILKESVRTIDIAGRWGGEEFIIIMSESDAQKVMLFLERVRANIESLKTAAGLSLTASFGVATLDLAKYDSIKDLSEVLLSDADKALYKAKKTGKNKVIHINEMRN